MTTVNTSREIPASVEQIFAARERWCRGRRLSNPEIARAVESIVVPANEQNLDRLTAEVLGEGV